MQISNHRYRQRVFLNQCLLKSKLLGQTWTMHIDTDEYVIPSKLFRQINPDYVDPRPIQEPGSVLDLLQQVAEKTPNLVNYPCISMPRLLFGSVENKEDDGLIDSNIPAGFNATSFETIRWRNHAPPGNISYHGNPKVIVDVSAIDESYFTDEVVYSIHRPFKFCKSNVLVKFTKYYEQPIATNHYLGSWERYSGRSDNRRSQDVYTKKARVNFASDNGTQMWLKGFVKSIGRDRAVELLTGKHLLVNDPTSSIDWQTISS